MGKQKKLLIEIIESFERLNDPGLNNRNAKTFNNSLINILFHRSKNKSDIVRRILNEVVLSNEEIIELLRICFKKRK